MFPGVNSYSSILEIWYFPFVQFLSSFLIKKIKAMYLNSHFYHSVLVNFSFFEKAKGGLRDNLPGKRIECSSRGHRFSFQDPHGSSHPTVTPGPGDLMCSSDLQCH